MSEATPGHRIRRLAVEALSVAAGVLLAFSVDAWWERVQEQDNVDGLRSAAQIEAEANRQLLVRYQTVGDASLGAGRELVELIGPEPDVVPLDSVLYLMGTLLTYNAAPLEFAATDRLLSSGDVEELLDPEFHRSLLTLRSSATRYYDMGLRFERIHEALVLEFGEVAPLAVLSASKGGVHGPSDFPVDVEAILSSAALEGAVGNLGVWVDNLDQTVGRLIELSDAAWIADESRAESGPSS